MARTLDILTRMHTEMAVQTLVDIMTDPEAKDRDRITASQDILDRGHGKPVAAVIQIPADKVQRAMLSSLGDEELLSILRRVQLPRLQDTPLDTSLNTPLDASFTETPTLADPLLV